MNKNYFSIARWIAEYLSGNEICESQRELEEWRREAGNEELIRKIEQDARMRIAGKRYDDFPCREGWERMQAKRLRRRHRYLFRKLGTCAAIVAVFLGSVLFFYLQTGREKGESVPVIVQNTEPGGSKARLILDNGKEIDLAKEQGMIGNSEASITNSGHCLTYQMDSSMVRNTPVFHELIVPVGGEYQLQLSDGTVVCLNAMTKLRFPNSFQGEIREVELEGEAYFKVTKNPEQPFVVRNRNSVVYVYGTQFNVSAYPDEAETHTTLVEGKLAVEHSGQRREIRPGEQWCYHQGTGEVTVKSVDVTLYTAWKDGRLRFNDVRLEEIMRTVSRWYGVEVIYQSEDLKDLLFGCNFDRHSSIEPLLRVFEANGKISIERQKNRLKIKRRR